MTTAQITKEKAHPFELSGMGIAPFKFCYMWSFPSPEMAEKNPEGYNAAMREMPRDLIGGCGTCYNCGMAIRNVCVVENAEGRRYGVGSDCVLKTEDKGLGNSTKVAVARHQAKLRRQKADQNREVKRLLWLSTVCNDKGETNQQRIQREYQEAIDSTRLAKEKMMQKWGFILPVLEGQTGQFCQSIAQQIRNGGDVTGRALEIVREIFGKNHGRVNSDAYKKAVAHFDTQIL